MKKKGGPRECRREMEECGAEINKKSGRNERTCVWVGDVRSASSRVLCVILHAWVDGAGYLTSE